MSYYYRNKYSFSYHALNRIRERLALEELNDFELKFYCTNLIENSSNVTTTTKHQYVKINNQNLYFIIDNQTNLIKTISPLSAHKLLLAIENDN